jgi:hypothetical protein
MNITITGASGFVGRRLIERLLTENHSLHLLGRTPRSGVPFSTWDVLGESAPPVESLVSADALVHLAGEPVAQRWTPEAKRRIRASRVEGTRRLVEGLSALVRRPAVLVCASAIGIYGSRGDEILTESSPTGQGFLADVCREWESAADLAQPLGVRVVKLRIGMVLGREGGALARMLPAFKAGLGGRLGSGKQWMSWIHLDDLVELIRYLIEHPEVRGVVNATAPNPARNAQFTRALASVLHRPAFVPVPAFALKLVFGEMAQILLESQRVLSQAAGLRFRYPELAPALRQLLA